jgi:hypothetical protein
MAFPMISSQGMVKLYQHKPAGALRQLGRQGSPSRADFKDGIIRLDTCGINDFINYILVYQKVLS